MIMPEDKIIHLILSGKFIGKLIKRLIFATENILSIMRQPISARPTVSKPESQPWMQETEQELKETVVEHSTKETVSERHRTKAIAMTKTEYFSSYFDKSRLF